MNLSDVPTRVQEWKSNHFVYRLSDSNCNWVSQKKNFLFQNQPNMMDDA